ncbi:MAG: MFS transporter [Chitinophagales bacterium]|nr:MFS transporter [Chitinophagales bacterium]
MHKVFIMISMVAAGEGIFLLPFVLVRVFRPTILDVFEINNLQLGLAFSAYGTVAMGSYFLGGPLADIFSARKLMSFALVSTAIGGFVFASVPDLNLLVVLYAFWGLTTILLFWAALIKATRVWGGASSQGKAYGLLDGGRGLMAALMASIAVFVFSSLLPDPAFANITEKTYALRAVILMISFLVILIAIIVFFLVPDTPASHDVGSIKRISLEGLKDGLSRPSIWLQAVIVVCAYVAYKGTDDFSLYVYDTFNYDDVEAAKIASISLWVRPFAAVSAGFLGDRIQSSTVLLLGFMIIIFGSTFITFGLLGSGVYVSIVAVVVTTSIGIHALRGVYFVLFEEAKVPLLYTGSAIGIVSFIGYTPDIFMGPLMGFLLDRSPGEVGHQHVFALIASFAAVGLLATIIFKLINKK